MLNTKDKTNSRTYTNRNIGSSKEPEYFKTYYQFIVRNKKGIHLTRDEYIAINAFHRCYMKFLKLSKQQIDIQQKLKHNDMEYNMAVKVLQYYGWLISDKHRDEILYFIDEMVNEQRLDKTIDIRELVLEKLKEFRKLEEIEHKKMFIENEGEHNEQ